MMYGFGVGYWSKDPAWEAKVKALIGYGTGRYEIDPAYLQAYLSEGSLDWRIEYSQAQGLKKGGRENRPPIDLSFT